MIAIITMPHRMADPNTVVPPAWILASEGGILGERIEDWIPSRGLRLVGQVEILGDDFARSAGLQPADEVVVTAAWRSTATHLRGCCRAGPFRLDRCGDPIPLELMIPPGDLDEGLVLRTAVSLHRRTGRGTDPTLAGRTGSVLWHDHPTGRSVALGSARFPVSAIDFTASRFGEAGSSWRLVIDASDLSAPFRGAVRLLINTRNDRLLAAVTDGWRDPGAAVVRNLLGFAVQHDLVHAALDRAGDMVGLVPDAGSIGEGLASILAERFPDMEPLAIRRERDRDPQAFETHLQARLGLLQIGDAP